MQDVTNLCNAVMKGVARSIPAGKKIADYGQAVEVMRAEVKALLMGDEYGVARECVLRGSLHDSYVIGLVVASCLTKIPLTSR
jgi:hypothetical protein